MSLLQLVATCRVEAEKHLFTVRYTGNCYFRSSDYSSYLLNMKTM